VIRAAGSDFCAVTGGTRVLSDWLVVRVTADPRRHVPGPDDRDGRKREAAQNAQRDRADDPAGGADADVPAGVRRTLYPMSRFQRAGQRSRNRRSRSPC